MKKQRETKPAQKVYLVEDVYENPGRIYAVFADEEEARDLALSLAYVMSEGRGPSNFDDYAMLLGHGKPRETWWSHDRSSWVEVTYLGES